MGRGGAIASSLSQNDRIEAITRSRLTPQSAPFPDLSTFGPVIVCGVRFYCLVTASCGKKGYTQEKYGNTTRFRPRGAGDIKDTEVGHSSVDTYCWTPV